MKPGGSVPPVGRVACDRGKDGWACEREPGARPGGTAPREPFSEKELARRWEQVRRHRLALSLFLLPPLLFFVFLVVWLREGFILLPLAAGIYLYMLAQFFLVHDPARKMKERKSKGDEAVT